MTREKNFKDPPGKKFQEAFPEKKINPWAEMTSTIVLFYQQVIKHLRLTRSFVYSMSKNAPKTDPCGTPESVFHEIYLTKTF